MSRPKDLTHTNEASRLAAIRAAEILIDIEAVNFRPNNPYTFTSGRKSPSYIDCRRIISFPEERKELTNLAVELLKRESQLDKIDVVAGGETAGIPFSAWIADELKKPMIYVRKQPKGFARMAQIEGDLPQRTRVLLVEDLTTDGGTKVKFIEALRHAGALVSDTYVVFHYGIFPQSTETMNNLGVKLHALATWWDVLDVARDRQLYTPKELDIVESYLKDPEGWSSQQEKNNESSK